MKYSFACPLEGCDYVMSVDADDEDSAVEKLLGEAKSHVADAHPDLNKTDDEIRDEIREKMEVEKMEVNNG